MNPASAKFANHFQCDEHKIINKSTKRQNQTTFLENDAILGGMMDN